MSRTSSSVCGANLTEGSVRPVRSSARAILQPVLRHEREVVLLVEDLAADLRIPLPELADLPVLPGDQLLVQRRDLDVEVELRQVEVGREAPDDVALPVPLDVEGRGLVLPGDPVEVQELSELSLGGVRERDGVALREGLERLRGRAHDPPATARLRFDRVPSRSVHTWSSAIANTPWPFRRRSITASGEWASYTPRPSDIRVTPCGGRFIDCRCSTAFRTRCSEIPVSSSFLITRSVTRSWNE